MRFDLVNSDNAREVAREIAKATDEWIGDFNKDVETRKYCIDQAIKFGQDYLVERADKIYDYLMKNMK